MRGRKTIIKKAYFAFLLHFFFCLFFIYPPPRAASSTIFRNPAWLKKTNLEILWVLLKINAILRERGRSLSLACSPSSSSALPAARLAGSRAARRLQAGSVLLPEPGVWGGAGKPPLRPTSAERFDPAAPPFNNEPKGHLPTYVFLRWVGSPSDTPRPVGLRQLVSAGRPGPPFPAGEGPRRVPFARPGVGGQRGRRSRGRRARRRPSGSGRDGASPQPLAGPLP